MAFEWKNVEAPSGNASLAAIAEAYKSMNNAFNPLAKLGENMVAEENNRFQRALEYAKYKENIRQFGITSDETSKHNRATEKHNADTLAFQIKDADEKNAIQRAANDAIDRWRMGTLSIQQNEDRRAQYKFDEEIRNNEKFKSIYQDVYGEAGKTQEKINQIATENQQLLADSKAVDDSVTSINAEYEKFKPLLQGAPKEQTVTTLYPDYFGGRDYEDTKVIAPSAEEVKKYNDLLQNYKSTYGDLDVKETLAELERSKENLLKQQKELSGRKAIQHDAPIAELTKQYNRESSDQWRNEELEKRLAANGLGNRISELSHMKEGSVSSANKNLAVKAAIDRYNAEQAAIADTQKPEQAATDFIAKNKGEGKLFSGDDDGKTFLKMFGAINAATGSSLSNSKLIYLASMSMDVENNNLFRFNMTDNQIRQRAERVAKEIIKDDNARKLYRQMMEEYLKENKS